MSTELRRHERATPTLVVLVLTLALIAAGAFAYGPRIARSLGWLSSAQSPNPATPGNFTGYAFDQCNAPSQSAMDAWMKSSPYLGVGIYISGASRGCLAQPNLTPAWVRTQLAKGWKLLPITLGPQASCSARFPRYGNDPVISANSANSYAAAFNQGVNEAKRAVAAASGLGIVKGSTLFYDLEAFNSSNTACRVSALHFLTGWVKYLQSVGYASAVYSSASSGIAALEDASSDSTYAMPRQVWIADWDGTPGTASEYISSKAWNPHSRVKQYRGGHNETHGGVTINIDNDFIDTGLGSVASSVRHCPQAATYGIKVDFATYPQLQPAFPGHVPSPDLIKALRCLLSERAGFAGGVSPAYDRTLINFVKNWQSSKGFTPTGKFTTQSWMALFAANSHPLLKFGSGSEEVRDLQRALNTANPKLGLPETGVSLDMTAAAVRAYRAKYGMTQVSIVDGSVWALIAAGKA